LSAGAITSGSIGIVRTLASDFGAPITLYSSARCRTCSSHAFRSMSDQRNPRTMSALGQKRTFATHKRMSAKCQKRTSSFNYLIGALTTVPL
jgi:hypothetical protein